jgi:hypothetical protein
VRRALGRRQERFSLGRLAFRWEELHDTAVGVEEAGPKGALRTLKLRERTRDSATKGPRPADSPLQVLATNPRQGLLDLRPLGRISPGGIQR